MAQKSRTSSLAFTLVALIAVAFCIRLGSWQFDRYQLRHEITREISAALESKPMPLSASSRGKLGEWSKVTIDGKFDQKLQRTFRGHYFQNQYGLEVLSLFIPSDNELPPTWVDRGWIQTTKGADAPTSIPLPPEGVQKIEGILRKYDEARAARGVFFALPAPRIGRIDEQSLQEIFSGETFHYYLKFQGQSDELNNVPLVPPGDGPHLAYAIQWWIFALLIFVTRIALYKGERRRQPHQQVEN
jgi:cytochrome oxidase assembly protein ShyY1